MLRFAKRLGVGVVLPLAVDVDGVCRKQKSSVSSEAGRIVMVAAALGSVRCRSDVGAG